MKVVLISTYELGRQPFGLASPAAWLQSAGHEVTCADLAIGTLPSVQVQEADLIAVYVPMHTATRLAGPVLKRVRSLNADAHLCCYGLYAPLNEAHLRSLGVQSILGGEFEGALLRLVNALANSAEPRSETSTERLTFLVPGSTPASRARALSKAGFRRRQKARRLYGIQPRLQTSLPPLPSCPCLSGIFSCRAVGRRDGGHTAASRCRRRTHHFR